MNFRKHERRQFQSIHSLIVAAAWKIPKRIVTCYPKIQKESPRSSTVKPQFTGPLPPGTSKCINTHQRNSSNSRKALFHFSRNFIPRSSNVKMEVAKEKKEKRYFLLSVTNDIFCVELFPFCAVESESTEIYCRLFFAGWSERENFLTKNYHFLLFDWFHPWWIAWCEIKKGKLWS